VVGHIVFTPGDVGVVVGALDRYLLRQFGRFLLMVAAGLCLLVFLADGMELLRRSAGKSGISMYLVLRMAALKLPGMLEVILPFVVLIAALATLYRLSRTQELTIVRAAGISVWRFLVPLLIVALALGVGRFMLLNPFAAYSSAQYEAMEAKYFRGSVDAFSVSKGGIWMRQRDGIGFSLLRAERANPVNGILQGVTVLRVSLDNVLVERLDARQAILQESFWRFADAVRSRPGVVPEILKVVLLPTDVTLEQLQDSFSPPQTIPSWSLPGYIEAMQAAGFSARRHVVHLQSIILTPLLLVVMIFIAASAALQPSRRPSIKRLIIGGLGTGFLLYFATDLVTALGISGRLPVSIAVWFLPLAAGCFACSSLFWREDG
jgi:lipopolysaccharide export system permease protein